MFRDVLSNTVNFNWNFLIQFHEISSQSFIITFNENQFWNFGTFFSVPAIFYPSNQNLFRARRKKAGEIYHDIQDNSISTEFLYKLEGCVSWTILKDRVLELFPTKSNAVLSEGWSVSMYPFTLRLGNIKITIVHSNFKVSIFQTTSTVQYRLEKDKIDHQVK